MKYIHFDVAPICELIAEKNLTITRISFDGRNVEGAISLEKIGDMLDKSYKLWGTRLDYFFLVANNSSAKKQRLERIHYEGRNR